jgi:hypothetical protein
MRLRELQGLKPVGFADVMSRLKPAHKSLPEPAGDPRGIAFGNDYRRVREKGERLKI